VLKKDFEGVATQFRFKKAPVGATLIRIAAPFDSIVAYSALAIDFFNSIGQTRTSSLGAARPLPPSADRPGEGSRLAKLRNSA
jgi:hypothetical protein